MRMVLGVNINIILKEQKPFDRHGLVIFIEILLV